MSMRVSQYIACLIALFLGAIFSVTLFGYQVIVPPSGSLFE